MIAPTGGSPPIRASASSEGLRILLKPADLGLRLGRVDALPMGLAVRGLHGRLPTRAGPSFGIVGEQDRLAVRCGFRRARPGRLSRRQPSRGSPRPSRRQGFRARRANGSSQIVRVVIARPRRRSDFARQRGRPLGPVEQPCLMQRHDHRKGLGLPRFVEDRPFAVARDRKDGVAGLENSVARDHSATPSR